MFWLFTSIVLPSMAPVACMWLVFVVARGDFKDKLHPMRAVKDGQLGWVSLAFCGSAIYELPPDVGSARSTIYLVALGLIGISTLWAIWGVVQPAEFPSTNPEEKLLFRLTLGLTLISAVLFVAVHFAKELRGLFISH